MPYALFSNAVKVSKSFHTKSEVWQHAERSGLVIELGSFEEDPPRRILDMGYVIRECGPDSREASGAPGETSQREVAKLTAGARINPRSAAAAS
jgi:hypothetical protein